MPDGLKLEWSTATVTDGKLAIPVAGEPPKDWKKTFERSVKLLHGGGGDWGEVELKKKQVVVAGVSPGTEEKLRHFLEGVVQQVNETAKDETQDESDEEDAPSADTPDGQMTRRFRELGDEDSGAAEDPDA